MSGSVHETAAEGFGAVADEYERTRPGYSAAAVVRLTRELGIGPGGRATFALPYVTELYWCARR